MGHNESGGSEKKSSESANDLQTFNAENLQSNMKVIYYSRTFLSIIGGVIAGILGFTGLTGFIFYFLIMAITSLGLVGKAKFSVHSYFDSWNRIILDGFFGGLMTEYFFPFPFSCSRSCYSGHLHMISCIYSDEGSVTS
uniref:ER membrane protein complex subunit 6 n=1 Tax=Manihot esculenta TaxID=3983 RepID=A0A2C9V0D7_MANES